MAWKFNFTYVVSRTYGDTVAPSLSLHGGWAAFELICESVIHEVPCTVLSLDKLTNLHYDPCSNEISYFDKHSSSKRKVIHRIDGNTVIPVTEYQRNKKKKTLTKKFL